MIKGTLLTPSLTLPLYLLANYTAQGNALGASHPSAFKALKVLVYLGLARSINKWLSRRSLNHSVADTYDWPREIALVTGGSDGIGHQITLLLAKRGIKVVVLDVQPLKYTPPPNVHFFQCDIRNPESIAAIAEEVRATVGNPTILINNAGVLKGNTILGGTDAEIRQTFDVNTISHYWLARQFLPSIIAKNHGMVVTIASQASFVVSANMVDYSASKAAALAFHEGLGTELRTRYDAPKVRTVLIAQGFAKTSLIDVLNAEDTFVNYLLEPETVAEAVVNQVLTGSSGQIVLPEVTGIMVQNIRSFPHWFQNRVRDQCERLMNR